MKRDRIGNTARTAMLVLGFLLAYLSPLWVQTVLLWLFDATPHLSNSSWEFPIRLFSTAATIGVVLLFGHIPEKRSLASMGFVKRRCLSDYGIGLLTGSGLFTASILICLLCGAVRVSVSSTVSVGRLAIYLAGYMVQGLSEEVLCRSYLMTALRERMSPSATVLFSALVFAVLHLGNTGLTVIGFLNVFLFGVLAGIYFLRQGSVWGVAALHTAWNVVQGNVFGVQVSGNSVSASLLSTTVQNDLWWLHGGDFGLEGGIAVTAVLLIATAAILWRSHAKPSPSIK